MTPDELEALKDAALRDPPVLYTKPFVDQLTAENTALRKELEAAEATFDDEQAALAESGGLSLRLLRENAALKDERDELQGAVDLCNQANKVYADDWNKAQEQAASLRQGVETLRAALEELMGSQSHSCTRGHCKRCDAARAALRETEGLVKP